MRLVLWQTQGFPADVDANLKSLEPQMQAAAAAGAQVLLCPELWLGGYQVPAQMAALAEELGVDSEVDILLGTFSKSLGAVGGFAACHDAQMDLLRYASRPYIFTASPSPSAIASVRSALLASNGRSS